MATSSPLNHPDRLFPTDAEQRAHVLELGAVARPDPGQHRGAIDRPVNDQQPGDREAVAPGRVQAAVGLHAGLRRRAKKGMPSIPHAARSADAGSWTEADADAWWARHVDGVAPTNGT